MLAQVLWQGKRRSCQPHSPRFQGWLLQRCKCLLQHMAAPGAGHGALVPASQASLATKDDKKSSSRTVTDTIVGAVLLPSSETRPLGPLRLPHRAGDATRVMRALRRGARAHHSWLQPGEGYRRWRANCQ